MISELRFAKRHIDYLPIGVTAKDASSGKTLAGPFSGRIIDISITGACLLMTQVLSNQYHVFYSTRESESLFLQLEINLPPDIKDLAIPAQPIWMNLYQQDEVRAYKMGVEFMANPEGERIKQLMTALAKQQKKRAAWWVSNSKRMIKAITPCKPHPCR
ncbi:MAG: hypothetical protein DSY50_04745 [Desulfobulbus sp.]|nr:MAG: hypothetical protein DSY50_04745 [Desulfobulbus sp.]RUM37577.1 MAG: hypothetical protein DSY58_03680 [Desulfobulbus sp.]